MNNANTKTPTSSKTFKPNKLLLFSFLFAIGIIILSFFQAKAVQETHFFSWPENFLFKSQTISVALRNDDQGQVLINALSLPSTKKTNPYFLQELLGTLPPQVKKINEGFFRIRDEKQSFFVFTKDFNKISNLPSMSFENDWWILEKTLIPTAIPLPKKGIIFLGSTPGKSLINFCIENKIPLLRTQKSLWSLKTDGKPKRYVYP